MKQSFVGQGSQIEFGHEPKRCLRQIKRGRSECRGQCATQSFTGWFWYS